jgi:hypothetical protein
MLLGSACSGPADVGKSCDDPGSTDACVHGAICTNRGGPNYDVNFDSEDRDGNPTGKGGAIPLFVPVQVANPTYVDAECLPLCRDHTDCPKDWECHTVPGAEKEKSCQTREKTVFPSAAK